MKKIVAIGEILFDRFGNEEVLGGAPFNYLYHLNQIIHQNELPYHAHFISKIGTDERGKKIEQLLKKNNFNIDYIQKCDKLPTGLVDVDVHKGIPAYQIHENVAFDYIDYTKDIDKLIDDNVAFLNFGTLFQRSMYNQQTLDQILDKISEQTTVLFDVNLRQHYYDQDIILKGLKNANILKLNTKELSLIRINYFEDFYFCDDLDFLEFFVKRFNLDLVILTRGSKGLTIKAKDKPLYHKKAVDVKVKDTVGAGDAFNAILTLGILLNWPLETTIRYANQFAADICELKGAVPADYEWYYKYKDWFSNQVFV